MTAASLQRPMTSSQSLESDLGKTRNGADGSSPPPPLAASGSPGSSPSPEPILSSPPSVPNPFAVTSAPSPNIHDSLMSSLDWSSQPKQAELMPSQAPSAPVNVPNPFQSKMVVSGAAIAPTGIRVPIPSPAYAPRGMNGPSKVVGLAAAPSPSTRPMKAVSSSSPGVDTQGRGTGLNQRRQKRLERNRESARLSRRRRKQYLEVLEERVTKLSEEMDRGRREHVAEAIATVKQKRRQVISSLNASNLVSLQGSLSRTNDELRVAGTFQIQQVLGLSFPPHMKFLLWLTLQNDVYFRGGRAASERLSAARIGERMLSNGNTTVPPAHGMWPLLCNEIGLSYDQEEKVRAFQRGLLLNHESWLHRHTASASGLAIQSLHDGLQALTAGIGSRSRTVLGCLNENQKLLFSRWSAERADRLSEWGKANQGRKANKEDKYSISTDHHVAANLYILNHRLEGVLKQLPMPRPLVADSGLKRLSRRPSFESLGSSGQEKTSRDDCDLSSDGSFSSSGSLKRSASELSEMDEERMQTQGISPMEAQSAAAGTVQSSLGFLKELIPPPKVAQTDGNVHFALHGSPGSSSLVRQPGAILPAAAPVPPRLAQILPSTDVGSAPQQVLSAPISNPPSQPIPSFLPPHLNVVPEEGFLPTQGADDFLFDLAEDWAIGEGFEMDTT